MSNKLYFTDNILKPKDFENSTFMDYRTLSDSQVVEFQQHIRTAMLSANPNLLCGGTDTDSIALAIEAKRLGRELEENEEKAFLASFRAERPLRTTPERFVGEGILRMALYNKSRELMGTLHLCQTKTLRTAGDVVGVKVTPLFHRTNVPVYNLRTSAFTTGFMDDYAAISRFVLNTRFDFENSPMLLDVLQVDHHTRNDKFETAPDVIVFDAEVATRMAAYPEINAVASKEGTRDYSTYKLASVILSTRR